MAGCFAKVTLWPDRPESFFRQEIWASYIRFVATLVVGAARRLAGVVLVDAWGAYDGEPPQHVARGGAERDHREAAHDAGTLREGSKVCFK